MNKLGHILPLVLFFAVAGGEASATIKFDVSHTANKAQETVSEWAKQAQTAFEESTTIQTMIAYGKGVAEMAKWVKEQKALVDQTIATLSEPSIPLKIRQLQPSLTFRVK